MAKRAKTTTTKKQREVLYRETSKKKFADQRNLLIKPHLICFILELIIFAILLILDGAKLFDSTSMLFTILLLINTIIPLISLAIVWFSTKTTQLLVALSLNQLCIVPLIIGLLVKYEDMKQASAYDDLLVFFFIYFIAYLVMTTFTFNSKGKLSTLEEK